MLHDLTLKSGSGDTVCIAKIDVSNDDENLNGKMINVNHFSFIPLKEGEIRLEEKVKAQKDIDAYVQKREMTFKALIDVLTSIRIVAVYQDETMNILPTTTTTSTTAAPSTTTTTTAGQG